MKYDHNVVTTENGESVQIVTSSFRRVTKSLSELRHGINIPELSDHVLFFNRVPKSGSEMLVLLLQWLQGMNGFRHIRLRGGNVRKLNRMQQVSYFGYCSEARIWMSLSTTKMERVVASETLVGT
jgi:hypothetical protein